VLLLLVVCASQHAITEAKQEEEWVRRVEAPLQALDTKRGDLDPQRRAAIIADAERTAAMLHVRGWRGPNDAKGDRRYSALAAAQSAAAAADR
jgi:hypothetical protein